MNAELIQELKSQCIVREQRGTTAFNSYMVDRFDTEKFAELIVRECSKVLTQHGEYFSGNGEPYHYAASLIEEHFGVAE